MKHWFVLTAISLVSSVARAQPMEPMHHLMLLHSGIDRASEVRTLEEAMNATYPTLTSRARRTVLDALMASYLSGLNRHLECTTGVTAGSPPTISLKLTGTPDTPVTFSIGGSIEDFRLEVSDALEKEINRFSGSWRVPAFATALEPMLRQAIVETLDTTESGATLAQWLARSAAQRIMVSLSAHLAASGDAHMTVDPIEWKDRWTSGATPSGWETELEKWCDDALGIVRTDLATSFAAAKAAILEGLEPVEPIIADMGVGVSQARGTANGGVSLGIHDEIVPAINLGLLTVPAWKLPGILISTRGEFTPEELVAACGSIAVRLDAVPSFLPEWQLSAFGSGVFAREERPKGQLALGIGARAGSVVTGLSAFLLADRSALPSYSCAASIKGASLGSPIVTTGIFWTDHTTKGEFRISIAYPVVP